MAVSEEQKKMVQQLIKEKKRGVYNYLINEHKEKFNGTTLTIFIQFLLAEYGLKKGSINYPSFRKAAEKHKKINTHAENKNRSSPPKREFGLPDIPTEGLDGFK